MTNIPDFPDLPDFTAYLELCLIHGPWEMWHIEAET